MRVLMNSKCGTAFKLLSARVTGVLVNFLVLDQVTFKVGNCICHIIALVAFESFSAVNF